MIFEFLDICERSVTVVNPYLNRLDWVFPYKWMTKGGVRNSKSTSSDVRKQRPFYGLVFSILGFWESVFTSPSTSRYKIIPF